MFRKMLLGAALVGQAMLGVAHAEPVRPRSVNLSSATPVQAIAAPVRATRAVDGENLVGVPFLLPLIGGLVAVVAVVAVVASGDDDDSSPD